MESLPSNRYSAEASARSGHEAGNAAECLAEVDMFDSGLLASDARFAQLARAIENEIIPRLMLAHRVQPPQWMEQADLEATIGAAEIEHFAKTVLHPDEDRAMACIAEHCGRGVSIERIYVELLAPTARHFGELWTQDLCDFTEVTVGLGRLQRVLRELSPSFGCGVEHPANGRRILLLPGPGEQHTFGLVMVSEFFRRAGWDVSGGTTWAGDEAPQMVAGEWFDVLGFSMAAEVHLPSLCACIAASRHAACNKSLAIMVGGPMFTAHPEWVEQVGADGMAVDGREAPTLAERLIVQRGRH